MLIAAVGVGLATLYTPAAAATSSSGYPSAAHSDWAVDPTVPGDNVPAVGRSLFDFLVTRRDGERYTYDVPFPFARLVKRINDRMQQSSSATSNHAAVLIPLGRSLQRASAAPAFFAYPRVVLAATGEPRLASSDAGMLLKDRLYLGYQEKENLIEVISYNESAGRFEFQVVKDYRAGGEPRVLYANRAVCVACHQNAAPLFSRPTWGETNANPRVASLLRDQKRAFYGIDLNRGVDVPNAIDDATDRANLYSAYQLLWGAGCETSGDREKSARCRAGLFTAALQYRLTGSQRFDATSGSYREHVMPVLATSARTRWPTGLRIPNPDIPNRDPYLGQSGLPNASALSVDMPAAFDPLNPRPPLATWSIAESATLSRLVAGLADFIAQVDMRRLDAHLYSANRNARRAHYESTCAVTRTSTATRTYRIDFQCTPAATRGLALHGSLYGEGKRITQGRLDRIKLFDNANESADLADLDITSGALARRGSHHSTTLRLKRGGSHARRSNGDAIETLRLTWSDERRTGAATVSVVEDFAPVQTAVEQMIQSTLSNRLDVFADQPFRRASLMPELFARLGMPAMAWCCVNDAGIPPPMMETQTMIPVDVRPSILQPFFRYCATCHQSNERSPPNFLQGSAPQVSANLAHCAQRLYVRLAMSRLAPSDRYKTPMPPDYALYGLHSSPERWRDSTELAALEGYVKRALEVENGKAPRVDELLARGYENLRSCLP